MGYFQRLAKELPQHIEFGGIQGLFGLFCKEMRYPLPRKIQPMLTLEPRL